MQTKFISKANLPTKFGHFMVHVFLHNDQEHLAITMGNFNKNEATLCRVHSECLTGDGLFSMRCDCGPQLEYALKRIAQEKTGLVVYLRQEGRGIGLLEKIKAYELQDNGFDTYEANIKLGHAPDNRNYHMLGGIFQHFGITHLKLMTNNPDKIEAIEQLGVKVDTRIKIKVGLNEFNEKYIQTKKEKFNHFK